MKSKFRRIVWCIVLAGSLVTAGLRAAPPISYAGGDGGSIKTAVVIKGGDEMSGVEAEDKYLDRHFPGYKKGEQAVLNEGKRVYDRIDITTAKGVKKPVFFDITGFYGK